MDYGRHWSEFSWLHAFLILFASHLRMVRNDWPTLTLGIPTEPAQHKSMKRVLVQQKVRNVEPGTTGLSRKGPWPHAPRWTWITAFSPKTCILDWGHLPPWTPVKSLSMSSTLWVHTLWKKTCSSPTPDEALTKDSLQPTHQAFFVCWCLLVDLVVCWSIHRLSDALLKLSLSLGSQILRVPFASLVFVMLTSIQHLSLNTGGVLPQAVQSRLASDTSLLNIPLQWPSPKLRWMCTVSQAWGKALRLPEFADRYTSDMFKRRIASGSWSTSKMCEACSAQPRFAQSTINCLTRSWGHGRQHSAAAQCYFVWICPLNLAGFSTAQTFTDNTANTNAYSNRESFGTISRADRVLQSCLMLWN